MSLEEKREKQKVFREKAKTMSNVIYHIFDSDSESLTFLTSMISALAVEQERPDAAVEEAITLIRDKYKLQKESE